MNIRQVRTKIKSVGNVKKITRAMEMVSVIKMKKAQQKAVETKPYEQSLSEIIQDISAKIDPSFSALLKTPEENLKKELAIVISTNKGLCGSYNFNLYRHVSKNVDFKNNDFIVVGKKGAFFINKMGGNIIADFSLSNPLNDVTAIFKLALEGFLTDKYGRVRIFFNEYISTLRNEPTDLTLLPVTYKPGEEEIKKIKEEFLIEPDPKVLVDQLLRSFVEEKIRNCIIQAEAGEHSSRMIAMKNATENAEHVIYNLTLLRNKIRQEKITYELLDMMTAKESVEN